MGLGTVGQGVVRLVGHRHQDWVDRLGVDVQITHVVVRDLTAPREVPAPEGTLTTDALAAVTHPDVDVVVEVAGMVEQGRTLLSAAMRAGKHVVTANKALLSAHGEELTTLAQEQGVNLLYEAAVAGGVPVVRGLRDLTRVDRVHTVTGILNGSCNYILSALDSGHDVQEVTERAQRLGYLEADPTADTSGADAQRKLRILATLAFDGPVREQDIACTGIEQVRADDVAALAQADPASPRRVRLLGRATSQPAEGTGPMRVSAVVEPVAVPLDHWAATVTGSTNAVTLGAEDVGELTFAGPGAGSSETASAVLTDLVDVVLGAVPTASAWGRTDLQITTDQVEGRWYLRSSEALSERAAGLVERPLGTGPVRGITRSLRRSELADWLGDPDSCVIRWAEDDDTQEEQA